MNTNEPLKVKVSIVISAICLVGSWFVLGLPLITLAIVISSLGAMVAETKAWRVTGLVISGASVVSALLLVGGIIKMLGGLL